MTKELKLEQIRIDGNTQSRVKLDTDTVSEYAELMRKGVEFPDAIIFNDGTDNWLADGFHRFFGAKAADLLTINCDVRKGTVQDARLLAAGSNGSHGLKRSNADKRKAVTMMLEDHADWADSRIADHCLVGNHLVAEVRKSQVGEHQPEAQTKRTGKDGKSYPVATKPEPKLPTIVQEKIDAGKVKMSSAERERLSELPPTEQRSVVDAVISGESKTIASAIGGVAPPPAASDGPAPELKDLNKLLDLLGKAVRLADDVNRDLYPSKHHQTVVDSLDAACKAATLWKQGAKR